jgi:large subunit ribosomal protein L13
MKTYSVKSSEIKHGWHVVDAKDKVLGRLATDVARLLMGKHKPMFSPHLDTGDFVVVINAEKVRVSGNKTKHKLYHRHSGYPGGFKSITLEEMLKANPARVFEHAVKGMLPKNRLGSSMLKKLKIYTGDAHPHLAQTKAGKPV